MIKVLDLEAQDAERQLEETMRFIGDAHGVVLVYSISSRLSFEHVQSLYAHIRPMIVEKRLVVSLIGAQCDCDESERQVKRSEGEKLAEALQLECPFIETSARTGENVYEAMLSIVHEIRKRNLTPRENQKQDVIECIKRLFKRERWCSK